MNPRGQRIGHWGRYHIILAGIALAFVYILSTQVFDRWSHTIERFQEVRKSETVEVAPESLATRFRILKVQAASLQAELDKASGKCTRTLAGFLTLASENAKMHHLKLLNIAPIQNVESAKEGDLYFRLECRGDFHQTAFLLNALENSPLDIHVTKCELSCGDSPTKPLESSIEGRFKLLTEAREERRKAVTGAERSDF